MDYNFAEAHIEECWEIYATKGRAALAEYLGVRYNSVGHILKYLGFYDRKEEHKQARLHRVRSRNPFVEDTSIKYYLIGFILGDGSICIKGGKPYLKISSKDEDHIRLMAKEFEVEPKFANSVWNINVSDWGTAQWLIDYGINPAKSKVGNKPLNIPEEFKEAFICGLLDSDGCIRYINKGTGLIAEWWGHASYMPWIQSLIPNSKLYVRPQDGLVEVCLRNQKDAKSYLELMYEKSPLHLNRKYERFKNFSWRI